MKIDLNCDMGESFGNYKIGNDTLIFPYITSCNIACGFHGGDPYHIEKTIKAAIKHGLKIGAHPSYPDLQGFGRRPMKIPIAELKAIIKYQIAAIKGITESLGGQLSYVKPHGALYNSIVTNEKEAIAVIQSIQEIDENLALMGLAASPLQVIAAHTDIQFIAEAFADRKYTAKGRLLSRNSIGAVLHDSTEVSEQVLSIVQDKIVEANDKTLVPLQAQSICIHGDNPNVVEILEAIHRTLAHHQIQIEAFKI